MASSHNEVFCVVLYPMELKAQTLLNFSRRTEGDGEQKLLDVTCEHLDVA